MRSRQACLLNILSRHFDEAGIGAVAHGRKTCSRTIIDVQPDISKYRVNTSTRRRASIVGSLTVSIPLSITLDNNSPFLSAVVGSDQARHYHLFPNQHRHGICHAFAISYHNIIKTPYMQTSSRSKSRMWKVWRPGAEANVYNNNNNTDTNVS